MELDIALRLAALIALVVIIILGVFLIISLSSVNKLIRESASIIKKMSDDFSVSIKNLNSEMMELREKVVESLGIIDNASKQIAESFETIETQAKNVFNTIQPLNTLIKTVYNRIAPPLYSGSLVVSAASKAVNAFVNVFTKNK